MKRLPKEEEEYLIRQKNLHETSEDELFNQSMERINEIICFGTGAVEIKSGYGLNLEDELKMLRVIRRIKEQFPN